MHGGAWCPCQTADQAQIAKVVRSLATNKTKAQRLDQLSGTIRVVQY